MSLTPPGGRLYGRQLSLFGVEAAEPSAADLAGLLAGPGQVVRMGGTARVSIVVDAPWRVHVLVAELALRGLSASWVPTVDSHLGVRTAYAASLAPLGSAWLRGAVKRPPSDFRLDGPRLRLWAAAAGTPGPLGFLLRLGASDEQCWDAVGAALAAVGLPAVLVGPRATRTPLHPHAADPAPAGDPVPAGDAVPEGDAVPAADAALPADPGPDPAPDRAAAPASDRASLQRAALLEPASLHGSPVPGESGKGEPSGGAGGPAGPGEAAGITGPAYRITGRRRLARLAELVGERPAAAPPDAWPG